MEDGGGWAVLLQQTRLGPSSLPEERSEIPICFVISSVLSATPQTGGTAKVYRWIIYFLNLIVSLKKTAVIC